jgi:transposase
MTVTTTDTDPPPTVRLGIDVACRAQHQSSLADEAGRLAWSGRRFRTTPDELEKLWGQLPDDADVEVIMEPTRNAWVPLAAWFQARGATVLLVPPEQSADLRDYYHKHTKTDRLDSRVLARLPLLHPDGDLTVLENLGPAEPLKRAVRRRASLQDRRTGSFKRLDALVELLGPGWADVLGHGTYRKTALAVLERYADPRKLRKLGPKRLTEFLIRHSRGAWRDDKAAQLIAAADMTLQLWDGGGLAFDELAADIAAEVRVVRQLTEEIDRLDDRIEEFYDKADPGGIVISAPGLATTLAAGILGRTGDFNRFRNLAGVRAFTGLVPKVDQSGNTDSHGPPTKKGDPGLRQAVYLAADQARKVDPTLAATYHRLVVEQGKHHNSALCHLGATLITRIAACWRNGERYVLRDVDGRQITDAEGREICGTRYRVPPEVRRNRRRPSTTKKHKGRTGRSHQESTEAAPAPDPSTHQTTTSRKERIPA